MKTFLVLLLGLCMVSSAHAQAPVAPAGAPPLTPSQLDQLLGPLALYPDSLVALILPASTVPSDIVLAVRYQSGNGDPTEIPNQTWDNSVKALTHYPNVLQWLNQNLDWTTQLGDAFLTQPANVMEAIQQLRERAKAAGHLENTAQQQVVMDNGDISIEPANPDEIYMPSYDADTIYDDGGYGDGPFIMFGAGFPVGVWLNYGMDWQNNGVYVGDWRSGSNYRGWGGTVGRNANITNTRAWHPNSDSLRRAAGTANRGTRAIASANALPGATIPHGTRATVNNNAATQTIRGSTATGRSNTQVRDYTGRRSSPASVSVEETERNASTGVSRAPTSQSSLYNSYSRGSDARQASSRGQLSRQPSAEPTNGRQASESFRRPDPVRSNPAPVRSETAQRSAPAASAYHVGAAPAAQSSSARGAQSRERH